MVFRAAVILSILGVVLLNTPLSFIGSLLLFLLVVRFYFIYRTCIRQREKTHATNKSLASGMKSLKVQKENFKIINSIFRFSSLVRRILKKLSIMYDDLYVERKMTTLPNNEFTKIRSSDLNPYVHSPIYSHMSCNIYYSSDDKLSDRRY